MGVIRLIRGIFILIGSGISLFIGLAFGFTEIRYLFEGNLADAYVTQREHTQDSHGTDKYVIEYSYTTHYGDHYNGHESTTHDTYYSFREGHKFQVEYLSSNPAISERMGSYSNLRTAGFFVAISFIGLVIAIWLFAQSGHVF